MAQEMTIPTTTPELDKSQEHIGFAHGMEYFWRNDNLYRAPVGNPVFPDGYRCGRWHSNKYNASLFLKVAGLLPEEVQE